MGSLWSWWTLWAGATLLWGLTQEASVNPRNADDREEFLTAFLQNYRSGYSQASLHLFLTSMSAKPASVFIFSHADGTSQEITVRPGQSVMANISSKAEMMGSKIFHHAVVVRSDRAISVQAVNSKPNSAELTLLQPVRALGTEYFVFTPPGSSTQNVKEFAVVAGPVNTTIHVNLKGAVTFQGKFYPAGSVLSVTLEPFQVAQLQSTADLSGSKITASIPVAVLSGHTCAQKHTTCNHVVEQLLPTSAWGTRYVVATLASQTRYDLAFVVASQTTRVTYNHGGTTGSRGLQEGSVLQFEIRPSRPLYLTADVGVQVLLFGTGATRGGVTHDPYLVLIPDVASYCSAYMVKSMPGSNGVALVVTPTEAANTLMVDESALGTNVTWTPVPGSEFSFAEVDLGTADTIHVAKAGTSFGLLTFGLGQAVGFGTAAACSQTTPAPEEASCEGVSCPPWHHCKVVGGKPTCVEVSVATCRAQGDPHYTTFDGLHYDMMGTCTYTITELCSKDLSLPAFSVEAKNEHRNSRRVSYVGFVTVRAYGHSVSLARGEVGFARIDNQRSSLPVSMEEGRLRVYQSGRRAIVELDFGLIVTYDWDCQLAVSLPEKFKDNVCGLCGNYNGNPKDDFLTRDGVLAPNAMEFASKWKLDDGDYLCTDGCADNCPSCTPGQAQHYEGDRLCGMLTLPSGPFAVCHHALEPKPFLQECVYDMCVGSGDRSNLCRALSAYAQACLELGISVGNWRLPANCPLSCPANSRYEHCSPACPISCNPTGAPSNCSERPCVEGCVCLPGFVASGDACVAPSSCGCLFENHLLAPGEAVWADQKCRRRCVCDAKTHKMVCSDTPGCPSGERCRIQNGLLGCYPNSLGICQASGDPHYLTFDGRRFDFMGTCTYLLTGTCGPTGTLPAFRVLVQNEHRGSQTVSYTRAVRVEARGVKVEVRREYPGRVLVDGVLQYLPFQAADGRVQVYRQGQDAVVRTDFGLIVTYDWNTRVTAKVPSSYAGMLCGLCGNFNGRTEDDLELRGGGQAANALAFGNSWQEETSPGCGANPPGDCPQLDSMVEEQLQSKKECGIIADPDGPFQDCHYYLEPEDFLRDCVYDRCLLPGQPGSLCDALADYTAACQAAGATVEPWRTEEFCPMSCPLNSSYELCSHGCPPSCGDQPVPGGCGSNCHEDCVCDEGFVLSGESCVPLASCGCVHQGAYHPLGESFYEPGCKSLCHCHEGGVVTCQPSTCGPHEACQPSNGVLGCVPVGSVTCQASGDPHYTTFDGRRFDFMGLCVYVLAQTCGNRTGLHRFTVLQENERYSSRASVTKAITVLVDNYSLRLEQRKWKVTVNGVDMKLPVELAEGRIRAFQRGKDAVIQTDFGLRVAYDLVYNVRVTVPGNYYEQMCGLCGDYNGDSKDDFQKPDGSQAGNPNDFGNSWEEKVPGSPCLSPPPCEDCGPVCTPEQEQQYQQEKFCGFLTKPTGPLAACHKLLSPQGALKDCVFDLCVSGGNLSILCSSIEAYVSACQAAGGHVEPWRTESFCPMKCPPNSHYEVCADTCSLSCSALGTPQKCPEGCAEGCQCDPGFLNSGEACVPMEECGCYHNGVYYEPDESVLLDNCQQHCVCHAGKGMVCREHSCKPEEECRAQNGLLGCYPNSLGSCQASGDPHYLTFDGRRFDFMGTCTYLLTGTCGPTGTLPAFRVLVQNEHRGSQTVSYTRAVRVEARGVKVEVRREYPGRVLVDGVLQYLPFQAADGRVQVYRQGQDAVVRTDFGLIVTYDWNTRVTAKVPSSYAGMLCGLCGNFNGRTEDDLELRGGGQAANALAFGNSWQEETSPGCGANPPGDCPQLDSMVEEQLQSKKECGIIADPDGPFKKCHSKLEPEGFLRDCVYDRCLLPGQPGSLCDALADYTAACQAAGATVEPWRTEEFCPMSCPLNSSYELCSHGCPPSCGDQPVPGGCGSNCHEDCVCDEGFVLSGESCVPLASCGCVHQGAYHPLGESFYEPGCKSLCHCHEGGVVTCQPSTCGPHEACQPSNGVLGCVPVGSVTCQASGDPHYTTFDGRRFDFMGLCVYVLAQTCGNRTGLHRFTVLQENERYSSRASVTKAITVLVDNYSLRLEQRKWKVTVNGVDMKLPVELAEGRIRAFQRGKDAVIQTDFGLRVAYDLVYNVRVTVPGNYYEQMCGLCGDYNGDSKDDFQKPDGSQAGNPNDFGNSWEEKVPGSPCLSPPPCEDCGPVCTPEQEQQYQQEKFCGFLTKPTGPLAACHKLLSPQGALKDCVFDLCVSGGNLSILCSSIEAYVSACQAAGGHVEPWRTESFCPMKCPPNSHYEVCADTCSLSCSALGTPQKCPEGCAEGCQCDPGFLNSGEACVPMEECGCYHNGVYYEPDESVLLDNCQQHCVCHAGKGMVCREHSCKPEEECRAQNGLLGCYPNSLGSCQASGDPHYLTFDGRRFDFMGTCTYLLTGTCGPTGTLPAFRVLVQNEHRGSQTVSYTRAVRVEARGVKVEVRREYPGRVLVDGVLQYLPFQAADGRVQVYRQGQDAVVRTDFGLIVTYDWNTRVTAKVPSSYAGMLCGLCGNFNGRTEDDLELRGGGQAANALAFGNSWQEETSPGCGANPPGDCPQLDSMVEEQLQSKKECGIIADPDGPFKKCHSKLEPEGFLRDCVYDRCLLPGQPGSLCDALADYTAACQAAGATVEPWRTEEFCPMSCPLNSSYELCSHGCPPSCGDQPVPGGCGSNCHEDCVCDEGFVLSGESCVPLASCGCVHQGAYHPLGESFYEPGCKSLCHCHEGGVVTCQPSTCGPHEACQPSNGVLGCVPVGSVTCQASGDPHYTTFDGRRFDFMGLCVYVLAQTCGNRTGLHRFTVLQENERYSSRASVTKAITVLVDNYSLRLEQRKWKVTVNGVDMKLPVELAEGRIRAFQRGKDAVIQTDFGLRVAYDLVYNVRVTVPGNYYEQMCGLCGDYNGDSKDDFQKPDGSQAGNPNDFGNSWEEKVPGSPCLSPPPCEDCGPVCTPEQEQQYQQEKFCGFLTKPTGPLAACHKLLSPQGALKDCVFDLCVSGGNLSILCSSIEAYVSACQAAGGHVEPWRTESFCPMKCPPNSHYEVCADTCSLSCSALGTPQKCPEGCAEGCQCDPGFLNSGEACVPMEECGCYHNGVYYEPDESVLLDNCQQHCVCHAGKGMVCREHSCKPEEECRAQNGLLGCYPNSLGSCQASGDPHYLTFDGRRFDFMGTCTYLLTGTCGPTGTLPAFRVLVQNEHRGSQTVSYTRAVRVEARGVKVEVRREYPGRVLVDGVLQYLPFQAADGRVQVYRQGQDAVVRTDFGLIVTYDWNTRVTAKVPSSYAGMLCGLCGNFNGRTEDDLELRGGGQAANALAFGNSWQEETSPGCGANPPGDCPQLDSMVEEQLQSKKECGIIADPDGPFKKCHSKLEPEGFLRDCVYDRCLLPGQPGSLCDALADYTAACQAAGATVEPWRTEEFCPMSCPLNSSYELCSHGCPPSCGDQPVPGGCGSNCHEDCVCDEGFVLSGESCVPLASCGCVHQGAYHPLGESFYEPGCKSLCHCHEGGVVTCQPSTCGPHEACQPSNGVLGCVPVGSVTCQASGDPHYTTFDGRRFDFMGLCVYVLAQTCGNRTGLHRFTVLQENERYSSRASVTKAITVLVDNYSLRLEQRKWKVTVNGVDMKLPVELAEGRIRAFQRGKDAVIQTDFGLRVAYDLVYNVRVTVPGNYYEQMCGLCGDYNGDSKDDFQKPDGSQAGNPNDFGNSWEEKVPGSPCLSPPPCEDCGPVCTPEQEQQYQQEKFCGFLTKPTGPLAACHKLLSPQGALKDCVFDLCVSGGNLSILCSSIEAYVSACQAAGGHVEPWRTESFCPMKCPPNSHYEVCADTCSLSCSALGTPQKCPEGCAEGCQCDPGFLNSGEACVPMEECGCYHNGVYYEPDELVLLDNCHQQCVCRAGKGMVCKEHSCKPEEECQPSGGILSCIKKDPCQDVICRPQETCKEKDGEGVCVPNYEDTCWLWGDPHYHSFDGRDFDFQGTCDYVLATTACPGVSAQDLIPFTVTTKNENRGNPAVSYVRRVTVTTLGVNISIHKDEIGKVRVNGVQTALPVSAAGGRISVTHGSSKAVLVTDFGLRVSYDWNWRVEVTLPSSYHGAVCGLCGNMDRNASNDQAFPNGTLAPSIPTWGGSWRVPGWDPLCWDECQGSCPTCSGDQLEEYGGPAYCGPLASGAGGPFAACHAHVPPDSFFEGCVLDVCMGGGAHDILCKALAAYAAACQAAGIVIEDWRLQAGCELPCPSNSHYELCGPVCPASCPSPAPPTTPAFCEGPCAEGCQCDPGFVLSIDHCVPLDGGCGCWANGTYHEAGSEFWSDGTCSQLCRCGPGGGSVVCTPASCGLGEECTLLPSGQFGCHPISTAECQAWGDPHYVTLDGHRFDFQGTCEYLLSGVCGELPNGVEHFTVTVANEHRGSQAVSYTRSVTLSIYNHNLTLSAQWPRKLQVDGELVSLPFQLDSRLHAYVSGANVVVTAANGLSLAFDGNNFVRLRVPAVYTGALCGLCGNYNQDSSDDPEAVGKDPGHWQVGGTPGCGECVPGPCPPQCTPEEQEQFGGPDACGIISAPDGPLAPCHTLVPPEQYFQACLLDACQVQGHPGGLCPAMAAYVAACQAAGAQIEEWRRPDFCPLQCPANSHYELCGDSCPVSCPSLSVPEGCESICQEGCVCDAGFVLSGDTCVPVGQCGCLHEGRYYPQGEIFYPGPECGRRCECGPGGQVSCQEGTDCGPYEECRVQDGVQACHATGCGRCLANGGIHYVTLDGRVYDLHGTCSYVLAQVCHPQPGDEDFSIVLEKDTAGKPQRLLVTVADQVVSLAPGPLVTVDGEVVTLPVSMGHVRVTAEGRNVILQTTKGLRLLFDGDAHVLMSIPSPFHGRMCGLCGNFNGNWTDDFVLPDGSVAPSVEAFGAAWRTPSSSQGCIEGCGPQGCPVCLAEQTAPFESLQACGKLHDPNGPFSACHEVLSPSEYFRQCVYDMCAHEGDLAFLCSSLAAYTAACQAAGAEVKPWRTDSFCPLRCPANSHYSVCMHSCQDSCAGLSGLTGCTTRCFEGCDCDEGFLLSQGICIPTRDCGCTHDGRYLPMNTSLLTPDCGELCSCSSSSVLTCQPAGCQSGLICAIQDGSQGCWAPQGLCSLSAGGNLTTFDKAQNVISSPNVYELSVRCPGFQGAIPWYRVLVDIPICSGKVGAARQVHVFFQDGLVTVNPNKGVWVNGLRVDLPAKMLASVSVSRNPDGSVLVKQKAGVQVQLWPNGQLTVMVSSDHARMLCGACGNFDGVEVNDGHNSQGKTSMERWRAKDFSPCSA